MGGRPKLAYRSGPAVHPGAPSLHDALRHGAGNRVLAGMLDDLNRRSLPWRNAQFQTSARRMESSRREHRAILQAIMAQEGDRAAGLMRDHMATSLAVVLRMIAERP